MNRFNSFFCVCAIALIASGPVFAYQSQGGHYGSTGHVGGDGSLSGAISGALSGALSNANFASFGGGSGIAGISGIGGGAGSGADDNAAPAPCNKAYAPSQNIPYAVNQKANTVSSSITYPQNKGEILIHRPAAIIVKRPPTKVVVNHPPLVVKPAPVVLHKPPAVVMRKVYVKHHPRPVKVEPVYVNVVKPPAEKYFVNEKQRGYAAGQAGAGAGGAGAGAGGAGAGNAGGIGAGHGVDLSGIQGIGSGSQSPAFAHAGPEGAAANAGYQLLQGNQGLAALAGIAGHGHGGHGGHGGYDAAPAPSQYGGSSNY